MGYFKNLLCDILEEFDDGMSVKEIAEKHYLPEKDIFTVIVDNLGAVLEEV